ncbi:MAG: hypothetical protein IT458_10005 [Planctomycetes bacterium]|nr:hypothetical protein [Planctomycetota bacterium]
MAKFRLVLVPALLTLAVTILRLLAEVNGWFPALLGEKGSQAGGGAAILGISWLIPVFGVYFGARLARQGYFPKPAGPAVLRHVLGLGIAIGIMSLLLWRGREVLGVDPSGIAMLIYGVWIVCAILASSGWGRLAGLTFLYALLARLPVVAITYVAVLENWGTHYEKLPPSMSADLPALTRAHYLAASQLGLWVPFTVLAGGLFGTLFGRFFVRTPMQ